MDRSAGQSGGFGVSNDGARGRNADFGYGVVKNTGTEVDDQGLESMSVEMVPGNMAPGNMISGDVAQGFGSNIVDVVENTGTEVIPGIEVGAFGEGMSMSGAEGELRQDGQEVMFPERSVGEETPFLTETRIEEDLRDLRAEENVAPKGANAADVALIKRDHKIIQHFLDEETAKVAGKVNHLMNQPVFHPEEVDRIRREGMYETLPGVFGFTLGSDN